MSPEILKGGRYDFSADVYSFAFIIWEVYNKKLPFAGLQIFEIPKLVIEQDLRPPLGDSVPFVDLINLCWHKETKLRPSFANISAYLQKIREIVKKNGFVNTKQIASENVEILNLKITQKTKSYIDFMDKVPSSVFTYYDKSETSLKRKNGFERLSMYQKDHN